MSDFDYVSSKLGNVKSETRLIAQEVHAAAMAAGHDIWFMWGMGTGTEHGSGLALDLMIRNEAGGDWVYAYLWANRSRLRLRHVIWEQHITSTVTQPGVRRKMADRGNSTENHYDHNHVWFFPGVYRSPTGNQVNPPSTSKTVSELATEVIAGKWGNDPERSRKLTTAGYNAAAVQAEVDRRLGAAPRPQIKSIAQVADEVIAGKWGNNPERANKLANAGYSPSSVQAEVNRKLGSGSSGGKTVAQLAVEVIAGKWGNNPSRSSKLSAAGYNAAAVQAEVNRRLR